MSLRDEILAVDDLDVREVKVPEWNQIVWIKALSGKERDAYEQSLVQLRGDEPIPNMGNLRAKLVARALADEDGKRVFTDQDINALGGKSAVVLDRLFDIAAKMSGLNRDDVDELAGNSGAVQSGGFTSDSPETSAIPSLNSSIESLPAS